MMTQETQLIKVEGTCATCPYFDSFNEASGRGCCKLFDKVARAHHSMTSDCVNTIRDEQSIAQVELEQCLEEQVQVAAPRRVAPIVHTRIPRSVLKLSDSLYRVEGDTGNVYMVEWLEGAATCHCKGFEYHSKCYHSNAVKVAARTGEIAICPHCDGMGCSCCSYTGAMNNDLCQPKHPYRLQYSGQRGRAMVSYEVRSDRYVGTVFCHRNTSQPIENAADSYRWSCIGNTHNSLMDAIREVEAITDPTFQLVETEEDLLDKPFDELTHDEWERLKRYAPQPEAFLVAA